MLEKYAQRLVSGPKMPPIQRENARPFKTRFYKDMSASLLSRITLSRHFWFWKHRRVPGHAFRKKMDTEFGTVATVQQKATVPCPELTE